MEYLRSIILNGSGDLGLTKEETSSLLFEAISNETPEFIRALVTRTSFDLNFGNAHQDNESLGSKRNPLLFAIYTEKARMAEILIELGAQAGIITPWNTTAVHYALEKNMVGLAFFLAFNGSPLLTDKNKIEERMSILPAADRPYIVLALTAAWEGYLKKASADANRISQSTITSTLQPHTDREAMLETLALINKDENS